MFFLVFVLFLDCFFNMHLCAKLQPYRSKTTYNYAAIFRDCRIFFFKIISLKVCLPSRCHDKTVRHKACEGVVIVEDKTS